MPVIKVWCLPENMDEDKLQALFWDIVAAVTGIKELGLKDEKDMTILFPTDRMRWGLGEDIIVEIGKLFDKPERTAEVRNRLARNIGEVVKTHCPSAYVECFIETFNPDDPKNAFWASERG